MDALVQEKTESEAQRSHGGIFKAGRLYWIQPVSRVTPERPAHEILRPSEWKTLVCASKKLTSPPKTSPTIKETVTMIAKLGGYLGRKSDGPPGMTSIWRGWARLQDLVIMYQLFQTD